LWLRRGRNPGGAKLDWHYKITLKVEAELSQRSAIHPIDNCLAAAGGVLETPEFTESNINHDSRDEDEDEEGGDDAAKEHNKLSEFEWCYGLLRCSQEWEGVDGSKFECEDNPMANTCGMLAAPCCDPRA
ncbi:hypothetical protein FS749_011593, partial [Ceratobasidium sp. UAMH 11750]